MDYYSNSSPSMSSRGGRFSSRGGSSYRGGGRGDSSYRGSRGSYSSPRGSYSAPRGRGGNYYSKYESSGSKYGSEGRSHTRMDESSYRKPDTSSYRSSEHSHYRSDDTRKRMRNDSYSQSQGATSRRSHEVEDYRGGGSRYSNTNSYTDTRSYSDNRSIFKKPRLSDIKPKEDYRGRKELSRSSVGVSKLRSIRGRTIRGRGIVRRGTDSFLSKKRAFSGSRSTSATELLALRKAKLLKIRRLREKAARLTRIAELSSDKEKIKDEKSGDEGDKEKDDALDESVDKDKEKKKEDGEGDESETKEKDRSKKEEDRIDFFGKPFMKLQCPLCSVKCITFKEYVQHLYQPTHVKSMRDKSTQLKAQLTKMRIAQRAKQKKTDEEDVSSLNTRTIFCPICKLNYSQDKSTHQSSEAHKKIKNFLQPYCKICRISYKSPLQYESHICSLDHIRRKNSLDERLGKSKGASLDLDNFMVLDSVGSGDEGEECKEEVKEEDAVKKEEEKEKEKEKKKEEKLSDEDMNLGVEFIRKVEAFYCEVCRIYLPRLMSEEKALRVHCRSKNHLRCYLRFGSEELLEQIQNRGDKKKSNKSSGEKSSEKGDDKDDKKENHDESVEDESGIDDKLWADVSDLLKEVEPEAKSDDEDEEEGGRFDRFKSNEKKENGEVAASEDASSEQDNAAPVTAESAEAEKKKEET